VRAVAFADGVQTALDDDDDLDDVEGDDLDGEDDLADLGAEDVVGADVPESADGPDGPDDRLVEDVDAGIDKPADTAGSDSDERADDAKGDKDEFVAQAPAEDEPADGAEKRPNA
jgi:hypothetical protein